MFGKRVRNMQMKTWYCGCNLVVVLYIRKLIQIHVNERNAA